MRLNCRCSGLKATPALVLLCAVTAIALPAQTFTTLLYFEGANGGSTLITDLQGNLAGATSDGGAYSKTCNEPYGCGTVFYITPNDSLTTVFSFDGADGEFPIGLVQTTDGDLYGVTSQGGANSCAAYDLPQCGTIFKITHGSFSTLYNFCSESNCTDGYQPSAGLVQASDGDFYGTTLGGYGTIFKITSTGMLTTVYTFCSIANCADGIAPEASLIQAASGDFYGTTHAGGANGRGTVFKMTPTGSLTTLHSFDYTDGGFPNGLIQATDGELYGTTYYGGAHACSETCGTVFKITPTGTLTMLHTFTGPDGAWPDNGLIQATDGNLYGTTSQGGANHSTCAPPYGCGTIFKITPEGAFTSLHSFDGSDGEIPSGLLQAPDGNLYGTTEFGGINSCPNGGSCGTVFSLSAGLGPFVKTLPTSGKVGSAVIILGTDLTGATSVTFNGVSATFTVVRASEITTTVPTGATTGEVQVVTPTGTLSSNVTFQVR